MEVLRISRHLAVLTWVLSVLPLLSETGPEKGEKNKSAEDPEPELLPSGHHCV